jgi:hypothetical protein
MDIVTGLRTKAARERAWLVGDQNWMRRWLLERAAAPSGNLEIKSGFGAKCLVLACLNGGPLVSKALHPSNFDPLQPRVPAGNGIESGRWTRLAGPLTGLPFPEKVGGHHFVHQSLYNKLPLPAETRKVFDQATSGPLGDSSSNRYDKPHRIYNGAVKELFEKFIANNEIEPSRMTPDQARDFLDHVVKSPDPRIRDFNKRIYMREIMRLLRLRLPSRE